MCTHVLMGTKCVSICPFETSVSLLDCILETPQWPCFHRKKQLVKICGNDDPRSIYVDPEDLHPQSRLKRVINSVSDHVDIIWGCPRDTLISLIASQRYNKLIKRGETTYNEVILELDTDCVDTSDSKSEKVYHFHVESGKVEYVLMLPRESSEPQASESPKARAVENLGGLDHENLIFITKSCRIFRFQDCHVPPFAEFDIK